MHRFAAGTAASILAFSSAVAALAATVIIIVLSDGAAHRGLHASITPACGGAAEQGDPLALPAFLSAALLSDLSEGSPEASRNEAEHETAARCAQ
jgi:hypothetical protein